MKTSFATVLLAAAATSTQAFAPLPVTRRVVTSLYDRVDSSDLVKEALEISKKFGAASPEGE